MRLSKLSKCMIGVRSAVYCEILHRSALNVSFLSLGWLHGSLQHPEDHDKMSRRTKQVLDQFSTLLARRHTPRHSNPDGSQSVNFEDLTRGHRTRKEVAQRFYSTLVLKKLQVIDVEQEKPYGDIWLKKGGRYEEFAV